MTEVGTVLGDVLKIDGRDWHVKDNGLLVVVSTNGYKSAFAAGQWVYVREHGK